MYDPFAAPPPPGTVATTSAPTPTAPAPNNALARLHGGTSAPALPNPDRRSWGGGGFSPLDMMMRGGFGVGGPGLNMSSYRGAVQDWRDQRPERDGGGWTDWRSSKPTRFDFYTPPTSVG